MSTGAMLWGGAAYNNGILPFKRYVLGEAYTRDGAAGDGREPGAPTGPPRARASSPSSIRCRRGRRCRRPTSSASSSAAGASSAASVPGDRAAQPSRAAADAGRARAAPTSASRTAARAPARASPCRVINITKTRLNDPHHVVPRHERPAGRLPLLGLQLRATSSTPTTATRALGPLRDVRPRRPQHQRRPHDPEERAPGTRSSTSSRAPFPRRSAWSATCTSRTCS